jgi:hypothetical protein
VLSKNNFKVVSYVKGTASGTSVFGIGGSFKALIGEARKKMLENANLEGRSRAVINETVEQNYKNYVGVVNQKAVTVSAYIIEFTE